MTSSFRLRIAVLSALLSSLTLTAFATSAWWLIRARKLDRLALDVRSQAEREAQRVRTAADWQRIETQIAGEVGLGNSKDLSLLVTDGAGTPVYRSNGWPSGLDPASFPWPPASQLSADALSIWQSGEDASSVPPPSSRTLSAVADHRHWRIGLGVTQYSRVAIAVDSAAVDAEMKSIVASFLIALPLCILLIGAGAWMISNRALAPIRKLTAVAREVTAAGLERRIPEQAEDREFREMIEVFNQMLERLERSFCQAQRFSADAAHEMKTPLAVLQGQIERAIQGAETGSPGQAQLSSILDEVRRLSSISRKLLLLSQADAGALRVHRELVDLSALLSELVDDTAMLAPELRISSDLEGGLLVLADRILLPQVFHNLISNAIKYNVLEGWIRVAVEATPTSFQVAVANSTESIDVEDFDRIFDRFFRSVTPRQQSIEGVGLGLSVSREIVRAHGGELLVSERGGKTIEFRVVLPRP